MARDLLGRVVSVNVGVPRSVSWKGKLRTTSIWKTPVPGRIRASGVNLQGDDQSDRAVHGGPRKAVYAYAIEDYRWWERSLGRPLEPATFGENLTVEGVDLQAARPTERWQVGSAILQIVQPRVPCWKLGARMDDPRFPRRFLEAARPGAYLSIIEPGELGAGDDITLISRPQTPLTIGLLAKLILHDPELARLLLQLAEQGLEASRWPALIAAAETAAGSQTVQGLPDESAY